MRVMKIGKEKFKVWGHVFDEFTRKTVVNLISHRYFDGLESPISIGKEANLFSAICNDKRVIVKIYRLETCNFNKMYDYIKADPRYIDLRGKKRKIILNWVEREYRNIEKAKFIGIPVPEPITFLNNVLVLEFIGNNGEIAPRIKDKNPIEPEGFSNEIFKNIKKFYHAGYVHADLSGFNILNYNEKPVFIDFSQATPLENPVSNEFLERDVHNICEFFRKLGIKIDEKKKLEWIKN